MLWLLVLALLLDGRLLLLADGRLLEPTVGRLPEVLLGRLLTVGRLLVDGLLALAFVPGRTDVPLLTVGRLEAPPLFTLAPETPPDMLPLVVV